ncbi:hypothetical protein Q5Y75_05670 [Ruegeria sp. 2205SS24-7]|uniref:hypothetical protein n=1 Tax=Ruegeria discodermiae TaxID=3064389 RepID=UPI0027418FED|nr:hypothetical protein [Ruegeria sp. 2205SS24-7]MDP5216699.1 hypothetical protein [Ruegeria sp. 2205SS24-7]
MPKTKLDIVTRALRKIQVVSVAEVPEAEDAADATTILEALFEDLKDTQELSLAWSLDATPDAAFLPLADILASEIAPTYGKAGPSRSGAIARLRAYHINDDREQPWTEEEVEADDRAAFY